MTIEPWLPSAQTRCDDAEILTESQLYWRRESVFFVLGALFVGSLAMLNIIGVTKFVDFSFRFPGTSTVIPMPVAVGVLPYPVTFLCTDFISELYGRRRANLVVLVGFCINLWVALILWVGGSIAGPPSPVFDGLQKLAFSSIAASMIAYVVAQSIDVQLFHFWKKRTGGRHLWLRNNGSTLVSQLVDTIAVILITHFLAKALPLAEGPVGPQLFEFIAAGYVFKLIIALMDTAPFYLGVRWLSQYLRLPSAAEQFAK